MKHAVLKMTRFSSQIPSHPYPIQGLKGCRIRIVTCIYINNHASCIKELIILVDIHFNVNVIKLGKEIKMFQKQ